MPLINNQVYNVLHIHCMANIGFCFSQQCWISDLFSELEFLLYCYLACRGIWVMVLQPYVLTWLQHWHLQENFGVLTGVHDITCVWMERTQKVVLYSRSLQSGFNGLNRKVHYECGFMLKIFLLQIWKYIGPIFTSFTKW